MQGQNRGSLGTGATPADLALSVDATTGGEARREVGKLATHGIGVVNSFVEAFLLKAKHGGSFFLWLERQFAERGARIPTEFRREPTNEVVWPLLLSAPGVENDPDLRELFANLLVSAADMRKTVHPSFVEILRSMSGAEARLLSALAELNLPRFPAIQLFVSDEANGRARLAAVLSPLDYLHPGLSDVQIALATDNLMRHNVLRFVFEASLANKDPYERLLADGAALVARVNDAAKHEGRTVQYRRGSLDITDLGVLFLEACLDPSGSAAPPGGPL